MLRSSTRGAPRPLRLAFLALAAAAGLAGMALAGAEPPALKGIPPLPASTRGPVRIAFSPSGDIACVTEQDEGTLAVIDARTGRLRARFSTGGRHPFGVALTSTGSALVTHRLSGTLARVDLASGRVETLPLRGEPCGVAISRDGTLAAVALSQRDEVAVVHLTRWEETGRVPVGDMPQALAFSPAGPLLVANLRGGSVSVVDAPALKEVRRVEVSGVNLRDLALSADGERAFVTGQIPANLRATDEPLDIWTNTLFVLNLRADPRSSSAEGWLDFSGYPAPDPDGVAALGPEQAVVAVSGSDELLAVQTRGPYLRTYDPRIERRIPTGPRPRGVAVSPDGQEVWVAEEVGNSVAVFSSRTWQLVRRISLGVASRADSALRGRYLFGSARLTSGGQFSCNSCHPDGGTDGLRWEFVHVPDGVEFRNSRNLRGGVAETAPFRWSGREALLEDFLQDEVGGLLRGPRLPYGELAALKRFLATLEAAPNPYRTPEGHFTLEAVEGRRLFEGKAGCADCHTGPRLGGSGVKAYVGTMSAGRGLDVPHLAGAHDSGPYLHDGRAATLREVFTRHNADRRHGRADILTPEELAEVLRYVQEL